MYMEADMLKNWFVALAAFLGAAGVSGAEIACEKNDFSGHLQGIAADSSGIYWSFYNTVVKTDYTGKILASVKSPRHSGDLCLADGKVCVSITYYDRETAEREGGTGFVYVYDAKLKFLRKFALPDTPRPDGIAFCGGKFYVAGDDFGKQDHPVNTVSVYTSDFKFEKKITVDIGRPTKYGVQTLNEFDGQLLAAFYARNGSVFLTVPELKVSGVFPMSASHTPMRVRILRLLFECVYRFRYCL